MTLNTLENCCDYDGKGRLVITPNNGFAGMSGPALRAPSLGQIRKWRQAFDELNRQDIKIVGVGGNSTGQHVWQKELAGAAASQVGTAYFDSGENIFSQMLQQYVDLKEAFDPDIKFRRESHNF